MLGINHTATGVLIAVVTRKPEYAIPASLAAHFVMDVIPHHGEDPRFQRGMRAYNSKVGLDGIISLGIMTGAVMLAPTLASVIIFSCFFSVLPDLVWPLALHSGIRQKFYGYFKFHKTIQWSETPAGILVEAIWLAGVVFALVKILPGIR